MKPETTWLQEEAKKLRKQGLDATAILKQLRTSPAAIDGKVKVTKTKIRRWIRGTDGTTQA